MSRYHPIVLLTLLSTLVTSSWNQSLVESIVNFIGEGAEQVSKEPPDTNVRDLLPSYDFIVVGAGTAGCVLANRLSENPNWNVLLIEAGRHENYIMDLPILANYLQFTDANWKYRTEPSDKYCVGFDGNRCNWPRGKVMGGSSVLNYMIYTRGNRRDYDNWAYNLGNKGWSYEEVLPYFKKVEDFTIPELFDPKYHNKGGYLSVGYAPYRTKIADAIVKASMEFGMKYVDYNGKGQTGVSHLQLSMKNGTRASSSRSYLHPVSDRPNLHVKKYSMVTRILIDPNSKKTYGVEFVQSGKRYVSRTSKEVIVSAGTINSPQILMLSGIGPKGHLKKLGIPVLKNSKVGYNLQDHICAGGLTFLIDKPYSVRTEDILTAQHMSNYLYRHRGPMTLPGGCEVLTFNELDDPLKEDGHPDIELLSQAGSIVSDMMLRRNFGITDALYDTVYKPIEGRDTFMLFPMLLRPKSHGRIVLRNADYRSKPMIFPNYFQYQQDMDVVVKGIKLFLNITQQPALQALGTKTHDIPIPKCAPLGFGTDKYWECMARHFTFTIYHHTGTCRMGPEEDRSAVVDPRLRVYGVEGLRVIDASVMPEIPAAHTNAPTYMIAEKGADMIKQDWGMKI